MNRPKQTGLKSSVGIHNKYVDTENLFFSWPVPFSQYQPLYHGESN